MSNGRRIVLLFLAALVLTTAGATLTVLHLPGGVSVLWVGMFAQVAAFGAYLWHASRQKP